MNCKKIKVLIILLINFYLLSSCIFIEECLGWTSVSKDIFSALVVFNDAKPPVIIHEPIKNISPLTKECIIYGKVSDELNIVKTEIYYRRYGEHMWSTHTFIYNNNIENTTFYFQINKDFINGPIEYKIT
ncbi:MAG: hypothetical protein NZ839_03625, partial [Endomicrobia bacterium]|nr:hypothetical protein [Endomicrobiia bacterium]